jgi:AraC-like DNA-binding protein
MLRAVKVESAQALENLLLARLSAFEFKPHFHSWFTIALIRKGQSSFTIGRNNVAARPGEIQLVHPYQVHYGGSKEGFEYDVVCPSVELMSCAAQLCRREAYFPYFGFSLLPPSDIATLLFAAVDRRRTAGASKAAPSDAALEQVIIDVFRAHGAEVRKTSISLAEHRAIRNACERLQRFYETPVALATLASDVNMSRFHFCRLFRRVTGLTPGAFLRQVRLARACELVKDGMPLVRVAAEVGFADQAHLTKEFKKVYGYTPGLLAFRLKH